MNDFDQFFREHYARVLGSLRLAGGDVSEAEDAAQEAFAKAMLRWKSVSVMERPATWVYVVAIRELRRRRPRRDESVGSSTARRRVAARSRGRRRDRGRHRARSRTATAPTTRGGVALPRRSHGARGEPRDALLGGNREVDVAFGARSSPDPARRLGTRRSQRWTVTRFATHWVRRRAESTSTSMRARADWCAAGRRRRRQRRFSSATVLAVQSSSSRSCSRSPGRDRTLVAEHHRSTDSTVPTNVVYGNRLPSRDNAAIAYDEARGRVVLFGGFRRVARPLRTHGSGTATAGARRNRQRPARRERAAMALRPATKGARAVRWRRPAFANRPRSRSTTRGRGTATTWTQRHPAHEPPWSSGLAMSYDPRSKSVLLLTLPSSHPNLDLTPDSVSSRGDTPFGTWQWNGSDWRELPTPSAPLFAKGAAFSRQSAPDAVAARSRAALLLVVDLYGLVPAGPRRVPRTRPNAQCADLDVGRNPLDEAAPDAAPPSTASSSRRRGADAAPTVSRTGRRGRGPARIGTRRRSSARRCGLLGR